MMEESELQILEGKALPENLLMKSLGTSSDLHIRHFDILLINILINID